MLCRIMIYHPIRLIYIFNLKSIEMIHHLLLWRSNYALNVKHCSGESNRILSLFVVVQWCHSFKQLYSYNFKQRRRFIILSHHPNEFVFLWLGIIVGLALPFHLHNSQSVELSVIHACNFCIDCVSMCEMCWHFDDGYFESFTGNSWCMYICL